MLASCNWQDKTLVKTENSMHWADKGVGTARFYWVLIMMYCKWDSIIKTSIDQLFGSVSQAKLAPTRNAFPNDPRTHPTITSHFTTNPNPSSNQVISRTCDHGNLSHDLSCDSSRDPSFPTTSHDLTAHDPGNITHDLPRAWSSNMSQDHTWFGHMMHLLINTWKTMGRINKHITVDQSTKTQLIGAMPQ